MFQQATLANPWWALATVVYAWTDRRDPVSDRAWWEAAGAPQANNANLSPVGPESVTPGS